MLTHLVKNNNTDTRSHIVQLCSSKVTYMLHNVWIAVLPSYVLPPYHSLMHAIICYSVVYNADRALHVLHQYCKEARSCWSQCPHYISCIYCWVNNLCPKAMHAYLSVYLALESCVTVEYNINTDSEGKIIYRYCDSKNFISIVSNIVRITFELNRLLHLFTWKCK